MSGARNSRNTGDHFACSGPLAEWPSSVSISKYRAVMPAAVEIRHDAGGDRWRKQPVGAAQDIENLGLDFGKILDRVVAERAAPQDHERIGVPALGPGGSLRADFRLARLGLGKAPGKSRLDAVALQHLDPQLGQNGLGLALAVVMPAVPIGIGGEPRLEFGEALFDVVRAGCGHHRHDRVHEIGIADGPLERLIAAVGGSGDSDQMLTPSLSSSAFSAVDDVAHRDRRKVGAIGSPGARVDARAHWSSRRTSRACSRKRQRACRCRSPCQDRSARPTSRADCRSPGCGRRRDGCWCSRG